MQNNIRHKGFTVLEAVASIFIISLVLTTVVTIIINVRNQTEATNQRILATQVGSMIRDDLINNSTYADVLIWMNGEQVILTNDNCTVLSTPFSCDIFTYEIDNKVYDDSLSIVFLAPTVESIQYQVIHFEIVIEYYPNRFLTLEGIIYE
ncbi:MAG: hypothetical protein KKH01_07245 [Firmicutes bacterium]|nr:hypothetical protein [Bacillota bacterium]